MSLTSDHPACRPKFSVSEVGRLPGGPSEGGLSELRHVGRSAGPRAADTPWTEVTWGGWGLCEVAGHGWRSGDDAPRSVPAEASWGIWGVMASQEDHLPLWVHPVSRP